MKLRLSGLCSVKVLSRFLGSQDLFSALPFPFGFITFFKLQCRNVFCSLDRDSIVVKTWLFLCVMTCYVCGRSLGRKVQGTKKSTCFLLQEDVSFHRYPWMNRAEDGVDRDKTILFTVFIYWLIDCQYLVDLLHICWDLILVFMNAASTVMQWYHIDIGIINYNSFILYANLYFH